MKVIVEWGAQEVRNMAKGAAETTLSYLTDGEIETVLGNLADLYPEGMDKNRLNDVLGYDRDSIAAYLGYESFDDITTRDEDKDEDELNDDEEPEYLSDEEIDKLKEYLDGLNGIISDESTPAQKLTRDIMGSIYKLYDWEYISEAQRDDLYKTYDPRGNFNDPEEYAYDPYNENVWECIKEFVDKFYELEQDNDGREEL